MMNKATKLMYDGIHRDLDRVKKVDNNLTLLGMIRKRVPFYMSSLDSYLIGALSATVSLEDFKKCLKTALNCVEKYDEH